MGRMSERVNVHLVDGTYELFRSFFGAPPAKAPDGREVGAVRGLLSSMGALVRDEFTSHVAVAFDTVVESFRNELFDGYNDRYLASYGPVDTPELAFLPLEDSDRDVPYVPPPPPSTTVVVHDHGGALGWPMLVLLLGVGLLRKLRQERI